MADFATQRYLLIALLGRTPQILTETLYALCVDQGVPISEIWVISTYEGYQLALDKLLDPERGQFYSIQKDYPKHCGRIRFSAEQILVAQDQLLPVRDIRSRAESESFLELILRVLWEKTSDPQTAVHCSLAGGRKTMSSYMALVMQMLGREQDKLYHILLTPSEAENHAEFYYPAPKPQTLHLPDGRTFDSSQVKVELVEIPYVRLRERIQLEKFTSELGYRRLLEWVQRDLSQALVLPDLILDANRRALIIGDSEIILQPQRFCLYWYFADRSRHRPPDMAAENYSAYFEYPEGSYFSHTMRDGLLKRFDVLDPSGQMRANFIEKVLEKGELPMSWVLQAISRINSKIRLGVANAYLVPFYLISSIGTRGRKCYGIKLEGRKMVMLEVGG
jgi:CRISPR-associated protein (TIGR02584 family)